MPFDPRSVRPNYSPGDSDFGAPRPISLKAVHALIQPGPRKVGGGGFPKGFVPPSATAASPAAPSPTAPTDADPSVPPGTTAESPEAPEPEFQAATVAPYMRQGDVGPPSWADKVAAAPPSTPAPSAALARPRPAWLPPAVGGGVGGIAGFALGKYVLVAVGGLPVAVAGAALGALVGWFVAKEKPKGTV